MDKLKPINDIGKINIDNGKEKLSSKPLSVGLKKKRKYDPNGNLMARVKNLIRASKDDDGPGETFEDGKDLDVPMDDYDNTVTPHTTTYVKDVGHHLTQDENQRFSQLREDGHKFADEKRKNAYVTLKKQLSKKLTKEPKD